MSGTEDSGTRRSAGRRSDPPVLRDGMNYEDWAHDVEVWQIQTDLPLAKQGAAIYLSLEGDAKKNCKSISVASLKGEDGVNFILSKLKSLYALDENKAAYNAIRDWETYRRSGDMEINDFIHEWERRYDLVVARGNKLSDGALAYWLLKAANLSETKQAIVKATINKLL